MATLNLGILAHVDAGKTSLSERLLYAGGAIDHLGRVDDGDTQTDSLALERRRGITIRSAVASFRLGDLTVNLVDTPGHPDFIAEVDRVLAVLDGAVLVVSAVEGVQAQTAILMRALQRLRVPTLVFVNKIDRLGARPEAVRAAVGERLSPDGVALGRARDAGSRTATTVSYGDDDLAFRERLLDLLSRHDDDLLRRYVRAGQPPTPGELRGSLARLTRRARVHPVLFGSALTGAGVDELLRALVELLPTAPETAAPLMGRAFKVERGAAGERIAWVRLHAGAVHVRETVAVGATTAKITRLDVVDGSPLQPAERLAAGQIGRLWGLDAVRVGDAVGTAAASIGTQFAPPTLETVVVPVREEQRGDLYAALTELAEQDPLIGVRQDDVRRELSVSLYGEIQKEVVAATLEEEYGVAVTFRETTVVCVERLVGGGSAYELKEEAPFLATVGLAVRPAPVGAGVAFRLEVERGSMPSAFFTAVEQTVRASLGQGPYGWSVPDCVVTMTHSGYFPRQSHAHAVFDKSMSSTARDFRQLTPLVLAAALREAGTVVCEPVLDVRVELPEAATRQVARLLDQLSGVLTRSELTGQVAVLRARLPAARLHLLQATLPALTSGEGFSESTFAGYDPVRGRPPLRPRTGPDPADRRTYLLELR